MSNDNEHTVAEYLAGLPDQKRHVLEQVRQIILEHLPDGYRESISGGMITYEIPLERYPDTYNGKPLSYISLAAQKNHYALYLMSVYMFPEQKQWLLEQYQQRGVKPDLGKSCLRFRDLDNLPLSLIGRLVESTPPETFIAQYERIRNR